MKCTCDVCSNEFEILIKTSSVDDKTMKMYIQCPNCDTKYTIAYEDKITGEKRGKLKE